MLLSSGLGPGEGQSLVVDEYLEGAMDVDKSYKKPPLFISFFCRFHYLKNVLPGVVKLGNPPNFRITSGGRTAKQLRTCVLGLILALTYIYCDFRKIT